MNLEINIEQDEYLDSFTPEAGIKIDISNQGYMPFPLERGLSLPVGFASTIGLRKVFINTAPQLINNKMKKYYIPQNKYIRALCDFMLSDFSPQLKTRKAQL